AVDGPDLEPGVGPGRQPLAVRADRQGQVPPVFKVLGHPLRTVPGDHVVPRLRVPDPYGAGGGVGHDVLAVRREGHVVADGCVRGGNWWSSAPEPASHTVGRWSSPTVSSRAPSGLNWIERHSPFCFNRKVCTPLSTSQTS